MKFLVIALSAMLLAGCGTSEKTGSADNLNFEEQEAGRIGELDITPEPTRAPTAAPQQASTPVPRAATQAPTAPPAPRFSIKIIAGGQGFDPFAFKVSRGTRLEVVNTTDREANFTVPSLGINSGPIAPGGKFEFSAEKPGTFQFEDATRPFAQGSMEVTG